MRHGRSLRAELPVRTSLQTAEVAASGRKRATANSQHRVCSLIRHWTEKRVEAHVLVAFLGYCLWVCLKKKAERSAPSLTPWQILDQLGRIALVEVWFELRDGRRMCLPRLTQPEPAQAGLLAQLNWRLPQQPPPRVSAKDLPQAQPQITLPPETV